MTKLVIVESPAKAKTISKYLGKDYMVKASMGHLVDLPKNKLSVDIENNFLANYTILKDKKKIFKELKKYVKNSDFVYLATDPDREGEAISWHLKNLLSLKNDQYKRIIFNEITKKGISQGLEDPRNINQFLVDSQQARRILDRIVGYKLSPFLWKKIKRGLSAGRVQSAAIKIIVDRENEIKNFKQEKYFTIFANLLIQDNVFIKCILLKVNNVKIIIDNEDQVKKIINEFQENTFNISNLKTNLVKKNTPLPYITSTMQQDALKILNFSSKKTMLIAQQLYEGIDIKNYGVTGLITYMRTDSTRISLDFISETSSFIKENFGKQYCKDNCKKKIKETLIKVQNAHEAIRPSNINLIPFNVKINLTDDQYKLYKLIWQRYIASQMANPIYNNLTLDILNKNFLFRYNIATLKFDGYLKIYDYDLEKNNNDDIISKILKLKINEKINVNEINYDIHLTQSPPYFNEASLIKKLEKVGIGRPSTYAPIISTILDRNYIIKEGKKIIPTKLGIAVYEIMENYFKDIINLNFTAKLEQKLDDVENGKLKYIDLLNDFYSNFSVALNAAEEKMSNQRINVNIKSDELCPNCKINFVIKNSKYGDFLACPNYPKCKNTKSLVNYTNELCPKCNNKLIYKKSKKKFQYIACENIDCKFMTWDKLSKNYCKKCGFVLFKHYDKIEKKIFELCYNEKCNNNNIIKNESE